MDAIQPTWVVGCSDQNGLVTRCLLALEARFLLPKTVTVCHASRMGGGAAERRVVAIVADPPGARHDFLGLLRGDEASAAVAGAMPGTPTVAVGVGRVRTDPVEDAVRLAVTTLIDWGHTVTARP